MAIATLYRQGVVLRFQTLFAKAGSRQESVLRRQQNMNRLAGPVSLLALGIVFCLIFSLPASATSFTGTPSPSLSPVFGTLINFDDKPAGGDLSTDGTPLAANAYQSMGVYSITSDKGNLGIFNSSPQSSPNYVGTGSSNNFDGTILIQFTNLADKVGIGISDSLNTHILSIFGSAGPGSAPLDSLTIAGGLASNTYVGFEWPTFDIAYFQITGNFFLIDDLQFESQVVVPEPAMTGLLCCSLLGLLLLAERKRRAARLIV
jgi:hypothetical protein